MYAYISGKLAEKNISNVVIDVQGIGYQLEVSLNTYSAIEKLEEVKLRTYLHVREDILTLYGFADEAEHFLFVSLIGVSGIGPNTARVMLSYVQPNELKNAIIEENVGLIKSIKGIGPKTAQRLILELKDKMQKSGQIQGQISAQKGNTSRDQALSALLALGFGRNQASRAIDAVLKASGPGESVETIIKLALKKL